MSELVDYKASLLLLSLGGLNYSFLAWKINIFELLNDYVNKKFNYQFNTNIEKFLYFIIFLSALKILYNLLKSISKDEGKKLDVKKEKDVIKKEKDVIKKEKDVVKKEKDVNKERSYEKNISDILQPALKFLENNNDYQEPKPYEGVHRRCCGKKDNFKNIRRKK